jgi:hypothetical protein
MKQIICSITGGVSSGGEFLGYRKAALSSGLNEETIRKIVLVK